MLTYAGITRERFFFAWAAVFIGGVWLGHVLSGPGPWSRANTWQFATAIALLIMGCLQLYSLWRLTCRVAAELDAKHGGATPAA